MDNKVLPHDIEAEKLVLGTIMSDRNALNEVGRYAYSGLFL